MMMMTMMMMTKIEVRFEPSITFWDLGFFRYFKLVLIVKTMKIEIPIKKY